MKILIIGINGFIASNTATFLSKKGFDVYGTSSKEFKNNEKVFYFDIREYTKTNIPNISFDCIIYASFDKNSSVDDNVKAIIYLAEKFKNNGSKKQIFLSSISSISGNNSDYAQLKFYTEEWFLKNNLNVIRLGLVIGNGGLFKSMINKVEKFKLIPLIDNGSQKVKLISLNDVLDTIYNIIENRNEKNCINLFYKNESTLKQLLIELSKFYKKNIFFLNLPYILILTGIVILTKLRLNFGITPDNIKGLKYNNIQIESDFNLVKSLDELFKENL